MCPTKNLLWKDYWSILFLMYGIYHIKARRRGKLTFPRFHASPLASWCTYMLAFPDMMICKPLRWAKVRRSITKNPCAVSHNWISCHFESFSASAHFISEEARVWPSRNLRARFLWKLFQLNWCFLSFGINLITFRKCLFSWRAICSCNIRCWGRRIWERELTLIDNLDALFPQMFSFRVCFSFFSALTKLESHVVFESSTLRTLFEAGKVLPGVANFFSSLFSRDEIANFFSFANSDKHLRAQSKWNKTIKSLDLVTIWF